MSSSDLYLSLGDTPLGIKQRLKPGQSKFDLGMSLPDQVASLLRGKNFGSVTVVNPDDYSLEGRGLIAGVFQSVFGDSLFDPKICSIANELPPTLSTGSRVISIDTQGRVSIILINGQV